MDILLTSAEAARCLGVSRQTLYAYVSRGWVRSEAGDNSRSRRYNRLDLERLRQPLREFQRCLLELSDRDVGGYDLSVPKALSTGWRILELFLQCLVGRSDVRLEDAAEQLQQAWAPKSPDLTGLLNAALILCMVTS